MTIKKVKLARQSTVSCRYMAPPKALARTAANKN
jgi:hypothetical protein